MKYRPLSVVLCVGAAFGFSHATQLVADQPTGGDPAVQMRKVREAGLERFFGDRIHITRHKNTEFLEALIRSHGFDRSRTWMIGNSIRTDVVPALTAGIHAIHMRAQTEWEYNVVQIDVEPKGAFFTLDHLKDVPDTIYQYVNR